MQRDNESRNAGRSMALGLTGAGIGTLIAGQSLDGMLAAVLGVSLALLALASTWAIRRHLVRATASPRRGGRRRG
jgi:hypothetical protein